MIVNEITVVVKVQSKNAQVLSCELLQNWDVWSNGARQKTVEGEFKKRKRDDKMKSEVFHKTSGNKKNISRRRNNQLCQMLMQDKKDKNQELSHGLG